MSLDCRNALPLVPLFVDGELSEAQAAPLRQHLMECPGCRAAASEEKALKRWIRQNESIALYRSPKHKLTSEPSESEGEFRTRLQQVASEKRDVAMMYGSRAEISEFAVAAGSSNFFGFWVVCAPKNTA